jgi:hypothetical protein
MAEWHEMAPLLSTANGLEGNEASLLDPLGVACAEEISRPSQRSPRGQSSLEVRLSLHPAVLKLIHNPSNNECLVDLEQLDLKVERTSFIGSKSLAFVV